MGVGGWESHLSVGVGVCHIFLILTGCPSRPMTRLQGTAAECEHEVPAAAGSECAQGSKVEVGHAKVKEEELAACLTAMDADRKHCDGVGLKREAEAEAPEGPQPLHCNQLQLQGQQQDKQHHGLRHPQQQQQQQQQQHPNQYLQHPQQQQQQQHPNPKQHQHQQQHTPLYLGELLPPPSLPSSDPCLFPPAAALESQAEAAASHFTQQIPPPPLSEESRAINLWIDKVLLPAALRTVSWCFSVPRLELRDVMVNTTKCFTYLTPRACDIQVQSESVRTIRCQLSCDYLELVSECAILGQTIHVSLICTHSHTCVHACTHRFSYTHTNRRSHTCTLTHTLVHTHVFLSGCPGL